jgi:hypothetical protein
MTPCNKGQSKRETQLDSHEGIDVWHAKLTSNSTFPFANTNFLPHNYIYKQTEKALKILELTL